MAATPILKGNYANTYVCSNEPNFSNLLYTSYFRGWRIY